MLKILVVYWIIYMLENPIAPLFYHPKEISSDYKTLAIGDLLFRIQITWGVIFKCFAVLAPCTWQEILTTCSKVVNNYWAGMKAISHKQWIFKSSHGVPPDLRPFSLLVGRLDSLLSCTRWFKIEKKKSFFLLQCARNDHYILSSSISMGEES